METTKANNATHTQGEWTFVVKEEWPFGFRIDASAKCLLSVDSLAHSTVQKTFADCMDGVGFNGADRIEVVASLKEQAANIRLMSAAPALLAQCIAWERWFAELKQRSDVNIANEIDRYHGKRIEATRAAIAKATSS